MISKTTWQQNVPLVLQNLKQWVTWEAREREGRITKVPVYPSTRKDISINNTNNWMEFEEAITMCERYNLSGIGFVFTGDDPYVGIDIDHCVDDKGNFSDLALKIMQQVNSYTEFSPSGTGIHIIVKAVKPKGRNKNEKLGLEMYDRDRYFTFSGNVVNRYKDINYDTPGVIEIYNNYLAVEQQSLESSDKAFEKPRNEISNASTIKLLSRMKNGQNLIALFEGQWQTLYDSQSQAEMALCNALAFATGKDMNLMDQIFRESGLYRKKWDEVHYSDGTTYGGGTLKKAIDSCTSVYEPKSERQSIKMTTKGENFPVKPKVQLRPWYEKDSRNGTVKYKPGILAQHLRKTFKIKYLGGNFYDYKNGAYVKMENIQVQSIIKEHLLHDYMKPVHIKDTEELWKIELANESLGWDEKDFAHIINFQNGLYNIQTKKFLPHNPSHVSTVQLNCSFDINAECPIFLQFMSVSLHPEMITIIQEMMGYLLVPITKAQKAFILYGPGRTGKSTLIRIIETVIGERNVSHVALQNLSQRFEPANLYGKLLNTCADLPSSSLLDTSVFKILTGEDFVQADRKNKDPISFKNKARFLFSCNQLPANDGDRTDGFFRRLLIIPFRNQVAENQVNPHLFETLMEEVDGIVLWALKGLERLMANGFQFSESGVNKQLIDGYQIGSQSVQWFVEEHCELSHEVKAYSMELYKFYTRVCEANGIQPKSIAKFIPELEAYCGKVIARTLESKTKRAVIKGIRPKEDSASQVA